MTIWTEALNKEFEAIIERGEFVHPGTQHARFTPLPEDAERFYELVELKAAAYFEEAKNAR